MARSFALFSVLAAAIALLFVAVNVDARGKAWKSYTVKYDTRHYKNTQQFCSAMHSACVNYAGPRGYHHQLECDYSQKGPVMPFFCGGVLKDAQGNWHSGEKVVDFSKAATKKYYLSFLKSKRI